MFVAGYMTNSWKQWRVVCLLILSIEDVEEVCIIGIMIKDFLLFGVGSSQTYRRIRKALAALLVIEKRMVGPFIFRLM